MGLRPQQPGRRPPVWPTATRPWTRPPRRTWPPPARSSGLEATRLARRHLAPGREDQTGEGDGTEPEDPGDGEAAPDWRQDISDPATGLSRLLSERCATCILRPGDPMYLGAERTAAFIRQVLAAGSYVVCHDTLTYGDCC